MKKGAGNNDSTRGFSPSVPFIGAGLALLSLALVLFSGFGTRLGLWHFRTGFMILRYGSWCALLALLVALIGAGFSLRRKEYRGSALYIAAVACGLIALAVPLSWKFAAQRLPRIHDITTDTSNPPRFVAAVPLRPAEANPVEYGGTDIALKQLAAYPDVKTLVVNLPQQEAFSLALDSARRMGWKIIAEVPAEGRIEATDTTLWFGFHDDIVVRVTGAGNRSLVDVRSLSRVGVSDIGTNARRIRSYLKNLSR